MSESSALPRILAVAGTTRSDSYNKGWCESRRPGAREAGAEVTVIDLRDFALPLFDEDLEKEQECRRRGRGSSSSSASTTGS